MVEVQGGTFSVVYREIHHQRKIRLLRLLLDFFHQSDLLVCLEKTYLINNNNNIVDNFVLCLLLVMPLWAGIIISPKTDHWLPPQNSCALLLLIVLR